MMCMMALSLAIYRAPMSIYTQCDNRKVKSLLDCIVKPSITVQFLKNLVVRVGGLKEKENVRLVPKILHQFYKLNRL